MRAYEAVFGKMRQNDGNRQLLAIQKHFPAATTITDLIEVEPGKYEVARA
ncbi:hypothetical protein L4X63_09440 [Geomonas sp. Red32]|nr:hypothetical protein [Geomonas sp. Red32]MCM0081811.1 hypothetical protein [Geomonas sp. Red32]